MRNVRLENRKMRALLNVPSGMYQKHKHLRFLTLTPKNIPLRFGVGTAFVKTVPAGTVTVSYRVNKEHVKVKADFRLQKRKITSLFMLNEQEPEFFNKYEDSNGTRLFGEQIGAWDKVDADWASISNGSNGVGFRLRNQPHSILRRGMETQKKALDWVGLDYEIDPRLMSFEYDIEMLGA